jgi:hypothetical protein
MGGLCDVQVMVLLSWFGQGTGLFVQWKVAVLLHLDVHGTGHWLHGVAFLICVHVLDLFPWCGVSVKGIQRQLGNSRQSAKAIGNLNT